MSDEQSLPQRFTLKIGFASESPEPTPLVNLFHEWIKRDVFEGVAIDVHDYSHVSDGPGVILVAHEGQLRIDHGGGQAGMMYAHKRDLNGDLASRLATVLRRTLDSATRLNQELGVKFNVAQLELSIEDRLLAPADRTGFADWSGRIAPLLMGWWGQVELEDITSAHGPLSLGLRGLQARSVEDLLGRLPA